MHNRNSAAAPRGDRWRIDLASSKSAMMSGSRSGFGGAASEASGNTMTWSFQNVSPEQWAHWDTSQSCMLMLPCCGFLPRMVYQRLFANALQCGQWNALLPRAGGV